MPKIRSIKLAQNSDDTFTIMSFSNTAQLSIGQIVNRSRLEYWAGLPDVRTVVVPAPREDESDLDETSEVARVVVNSELEIEPCGVQNDAREFDSIMFEHAIERNWASDYQFADATMPDPGDHHLGTMGIKARISRSEAIAAVRRNCVRDLNGNFENAGQLAVRAGLLSALKNLVAIPLPF